MITDPVADYLTRIRNDIQAEHHTVEIPSSKLKKELTTVLHEEGYVKKKSESHLLSSDQSLSL